MDYNVSNEEPVKTCRECGRGLKGRSDKKYCDTVCRNKFNNRSQSVESRYVRNVNSILINNRKILRSFLEKGIEKVHLKLLSSIGFDFNHFTTIQRSQDKELYYCYELGYTESENEDSITILFSETLGESYNQLS